MEGKETEIAGIKLLTFASSKFLFPALYSLKPLVSRLSLQCVKRPHPPPRPTDRVLLFFCLLLLQYCVCSVLIVFLLRDKMRSKRLGIKCSITGRVHVVLCHKACVYGKQKYSTLQEQTCSAEGSWVSRQLWLTGPWGMPHYTKLSHQRLRLQLVADRGGSERPGYFCLKQNNTSGQFLF